MIQQDVQAFNRTLLTKLRYIHSQYAAGGRGQIEVRCGEALHISVYDLLVFVLCSPLPFEICQFLDDENVLLFVCFLLVVSNPSCCGNRASPVLICGAEHGRHGLES